MRFLRKLFCQEKIRSDLPKSFCLRVLAPTHKMRSRSTGSADSEPLRVPGKAAVHSDSTVVSCAVLRESVTCRLRNGPAPSHVLLSWVIDVALWASVFWRDYSGADGMFHCTVSHFVLVLPMSDVAALFIPRDLVHWYDLFRFTGALQVAALTVQLWMNGIDGTSMTLSLVRLCLCGLRAGHALHGMMLHFDWTVGDEEEGGAATNPTASVNGEVTTAGGPSAAVLVERRPTSGTGATKGARRSLVKDYVVKKLFGHHLRLLFTYCVAMPGPQGKYDEFVTGAIFALFAATVRSTHNLYGETRGEGPLTSFQAADALNFFIKSFFLERLIGSTKEVAQFVGTSSPTSKNAQIGVSSSSTASRNGVKRAMMLRGLWLASMCFVLAIQWPFMFSMFSQAPLPFIHAGAEISLALKAIMRLNWRF